MAAIVRSNYQSITASNYYEMVIKYYNYCVMPRTKQEHDNLLNVRQSTIK